MDIPELKPNKCTTTFICSAFPYESCVYYRTAKEGVEDCMYVRNGYCGSAVAAVNRMVLTLQAMGININKETDNG